MILLGKSPKRFTWASSSTLLSSTLFILSQQTNKREIGSPKLNIPFSIVMEYRILKKLSQVMETGDDILYDLI